MSRTEQGEENAITAPGDVPGMLVGTEHGAAMRIATEAGQALLDLRSRLRGEECTDQELRNAADRHSHNLIVRALSEVYPQDPILSEEGVDNPARLRSRRAWIVD